MGRASDKLRTLIASVARGGEERDEGIVVERLDEVVVEARLLRAAAVLLLAVPRDGDDDGVLAALLPPESEATS